MSSFKDYLLGNEASVNEASVNEAQEKYEAVKSAGEKIRKHIGMESSYASTFHASNGPEIEYKFGRQYNVITVKLRWDNKTGQIACGFSSGWIMGTNNDLVSLLGKVSDGNLQRMFKAAYDMAQ